MTYKIRTAENRTLVFVSRSNKIYVDGGDECRELSYTESRVLQYLIREPGVIRCREEIIRYAWEGRVVTGTSVNLAIFSLRAALGDAEYREIIQTVARKGYRFNPEYLQMSVEAGAEPPGSAVPELPSLPANPLPVMPLSWMAHWWQRCRPSPWTLTALISTAGLVGLGLECRVDLWAHLLVDQRFRMDSLYRGETHFHFLDSSTWRLERLKHTFLPVIDTLTLKEPADIKLNHRSGSLQLNCSVGEHMPTKVQFSDRELGAEQLRTVFAFCLEGDR